jgi:glycosyltransferase involved in cell wall biosynthesis
MPRRTLSVYIGVLNEERNMHRVLGSVIDFADEIIIVDSQSTDRTAAISEEYIQKLRDAGKPSPGRVIQGTYIGLVDKKQAGLDACTQAWCLALDADEQVSPELRKEIESVLDSETPSHEGFTLNRLTWHLGKWIRHGEWYPDRVVRFLAKGKGTYEGRDPHDRIRIDGRLGHLQGDLLHYSYRDFADQIQRIQRFSGMAAEAMYRDGIKYGFWKMAIRAYFKFIKCWILRRGFLDGFAGFTIAIASAFHVYAKYVKLRELEQGKGKPPALPG